MVFSIYARLIALTAGALLCLFLLALIIGHRRPRRFERVLFFLILAQFLFYAGALLAVNAEIHYGVSPAATEMFANGLILAGLTLLPGLLVHAEVEYSAAATQDRAIPAFLKLLIFASYLPLIYFVFRVFPALVISPNLDFLWRRGQGAEFFGIWMGLALAVGAGMEIRVARKNERDDSERIHRVLAMALGLLSMLVLATYGLGVPRDPMKFSHVATFVLFVGLAPGAILGYFTVRQNFLQIGMQRNLIYAVSAAFLALLYLALVRRLSGWFEPVLPPEATAAILLFLLVFAFEPLERVIGHTLYSSFQERMDRMQRLVIELQGEAQHGEPARFISAAERRIREEFGLSVVRLSIPAPSNLAPLPAPGGLGHCVRIPLKSSDGEMGLLEACSTGAVLVGETTVALEFMAEQIPTLINHCQLVQEKVKLERELAERERLALVGQMAASISHNLRNPLGSMKTVLQVLLEDRGLAPRVRQDCEVVVQEIDRLSKKLTQLLQYARPGLRPGEKPHSIEIVSLTEQTVSLLRHEAERRGVKLEFQPSVNEISVHGFEEAWRDAISNIVVNAIEAQPSGGRVCVAVAGSDSMASVEISDDGPGIPADLRAKIFQPFFTTKANGTGLGLAIASRRMAEVGGEIHCESPVRSGHGARFTITVPAGNARFAVERREASA
jgi:two-component system, NtrC family, sensor histidine kinase HydH